jgi:glucosamine-6-phosphate deaminase
MATSLMPEYLAISRDRLGHGVPVTLRIGGDMADLARDMAEDMLAAILSAKQDGRELTMIAPVGPVDQFPILAGMINQQHVDCRDVVIINMDEYLADDDQWLDVEHPLSFRGYMNRKFYDLLDEGIAPRLDNRVFPDPNDVDKIQRIIDKRGGLDITYGGIGINGHIAFNEPEMHTDISEFSERPTRCLDLTPHTRTINANTVGGEISVIPLRAITVGMQEILSSRRLHFYCNRPWQSAVARRVLHGPITAACPASLLRTHTNATLTIADYVADPPDIRLR